MRSWCITSLRIPDALRFYEIPINKVIRMPISMRSGYEHIILSPELNYSRIGT
jgi:hypothetical protein